MAIATVVAACTISIPNYGSASFNINDQVPDTSPYFFPLINAGKATYNGIGSQYQLLRVYAPANPPDGYGLQWSAALQAFVPIPIIPNMGSWRTKGAARWRPAWNPSCTLGAVASSTANAKYFPVDVIESITIDQWAMSVTIQGTGGIQTYSIALYSADPITNLPTGLPILGLDAAAGIIDLTSGVGFLTANINPTITIPPGRYWVAVLAIRGGVVTLNPTINYLIYHDSRITFPGAFSNAAYSSALFSTSAPTSFGAVPTLQVNSIWAPAIWFRQTA